MLPNSRSCFVCGCCFRYMAMALASSRGLETLGSRALRIIESNVILNTHSNAFQSANVFWLLIRYMALALSSSQGIKQLSSHAPRVIESNIILKTQSSNASQTAAVVSVAAFATWPSRSRALQVLSP